MFFFFNDTATTEIYTLSLHDALPIFICTSEKPGGVSSATRASPSCTANGAPIALHESRAAATTQAGRMRSIDRKSTRLNSSHDQISYAVFCLKKKNKSTKRERITMNT